MADLNLTVAKSPGKLRVYAGNSGDHTLIIDHIILSIVADGWSWHIWKYQDDFYFGSGRISTGWTGLMFELSYSSGPAKAHATAEYFEVDQVVKSSKVSVP
jgi:hypothetical protein